MFALLVDIAGVDELGPNKGGGGGGRTGTLEVGLGLGEGFVVDEGAERLMGEMEGEVLADIEPLIVLLPNPNAF